MDAPAIYTSDGMLQCMDDGTPVNKVPHYPHFIVPALNPQYSYVSAHDKCPVMTSTCRRTFSEPLRTSLMKKEWFVKAVDTPEQQPLSMVDMSLVEMQLMPWEDGIFTRSPVAAVDGEDEGFVDVDTVSAASSLPTEHPTLHPSQPCLSWDDSQVKPLWSQMGDAALWHTYKHVQRLRLLVNMNDGTASGNMSKIEIRRCREESLLEDIKFLLLGAASHSFMWHIASCRYVVRSDAHKLYVSGYTTESLRHMLDSVCDVATSLRYIATTCAVYEQLVTNRGTLITAFSNSIRIYLYYVTAYVLSVCAANDSIFTLHVSLCNISRHIKYLAHIVSKCVDSDEILGDDLISYVYKEAMKYQYTERYDIVLYLLDALLKPLNRYIEDWIYTGVIRDDYDEFFININVLALHSREVHYWNHAFKVKGPCSAGGKHERAIVGLLGEELVCGILTCGKSVYLMQHQRGQCRLPAAVDAESVQERPRVCLPLSCSVQQREYLQSVRHQCSTYHKITTRLAQHNSQRRAQAQHQRSQQRQHLLHHMQEEAKHEIYAEKCKMYESEQRTIETQKVYCQELDDQVEAKNEQKRQEKLRDEMEHKKREADLLSRNWIENDTNGEALDTHSAVVTVLQLPPQDDSIRGSDARTMDTGGHGISDGEGRTSDTVPPWVAEILASAQARDGDVTAAAAAAETIEHALSPEDCTLIPNWARKKSALAEQHGAEAASVITALSPTTVRLLSHAVAHSVQDITALPRHIQIELAKAEGLLPLDITDFGDHVATPMAEENVAASYNDVSALSAACGVSDGDVSERLQHWLAGHTVAPYEETGITTTSGGVDNPYLVENITLRPSRHQRPRPQQCDQHQPLQHQQLAGDLPLNEYISQCLTLPIKTQLNVVSKCIVEYFLHDLNLLEHLSLLRSFLLLNDGQFALTLTHKLCSKLHEGECESIVNGQFLLDVLQVALGDSIYSTHSSPHQLQYVDNIGFSFKYIPTSLQYTSPTVLDFLQLDYKVAWPLNIILSKRCMAKYNKIFSFLLQIHRMRYLTIDIRNYLKEIGRCMDVESSNHHRTLHAIRHAVSHFTTTFQQYMMMQVLEMPWLHLLGQCVTGDAPSLQHLITQHQHYLDDMATRCLLSKQQSGAVMRVIQELFSIIIRLHSLIVVRHQVETPTAAGPYSHCNMAAITSVYHQYTTCINFLYTVASKLTAKTYSPHLNYLITSLNFNDFISK